MSECRKILILSANPKGTSKLRLDEEKREIKEGLRRAKQRSQFTIEVAEATRYRDLRRVILDFEPNIVHFSGHGEGDEGLVFEDETGHAKFVKADALAGLFELFAAQVECVILNACYSQRQAEAISQHIPRVIGMKKAIGDRAAIEFAVGFYDALGAGKSYEIACKFGRNAIQIAGIAEQDTPIWLREIEERPSGTDDFSSIKANGSVSCQRVFISYRAQEPDAGLAQAFYDHLKAAGHDPFMAAESIRLGDNWSQRIERELGQCDYFLLLLSSKSATSEMVTEEVRRAKELRDTRKVGKPLILPIRVNFPMSSPLNYDLRGYLNRIQQREWTSPNDTPQILQEVLITLAEGETPKSFTSQGETDPAPLTEQPDAPPVPVAPPELPGGQVDLASLYYVERPPTEVNCYETVLKPGALIRIKAPRQMGKTSLMSRILRHGDEHQCLTVPLSFQLADASIFSDLDKFLRWFCASVGRRLRLPNKLADYWDEIFGSKDNCTAYFEEYLLPEISAPLVLGLDEVDMVFEHPNIAADFMGLLRAWHESAKTNPLWKKLRLVVVHSTEVYIPMNINQSPFNVGLPIELPEFTPAQVMDLAHRHGLDWGDKEVTSLMAMVGGHPYLVRVGLYQVARQEITLDALLTAAPTEAGLYGDHLRRHLWNLEQRKEMAEATKQVMASRSPVRLEPVQAFQLHSMGIVHLHGNEVMPRCDLYRRYFSDRLNVGRQ